MKITSEVKIFTVILVVALGLVAFAVLPTLTQPKPVDIHEPKVEDTLTKAILVPPGSHLKGKPDAASTIVVFSDFQCPQCMKSAPKLDAVLKENKDILNVVFHNFQARPDHFNAKMLDRVAEAAGEQGKFWEMHDALFKNQGELIIEDLKAVKAKILTIGESLQLDMTKFRAACDSPVSEKKYTDDNALALKAGAHATPWMLGINPKGKVTYIPEIEMVKKWLGGDPLVAPEAGGQPK